MKVKPLLAVSALSAALLAPLTASADDNVLTGDVGLACEAILCLSTSARPSECNSAIKRYFSIKLKRPHKTIQARKDFLNLCPSSKETNMPQLINALANGAGRCNAAELNKIGHYVGSREDRRFVISTVKPSYCTEYENHPLTNVTTAKLMPVYCTRTVGGNTLWSKSRTEKYQCGQKWVDVK